MTRKKSNVVGFGMVPAMAALAFVLPVIWYYGPQIAHAPHDVTPGVATRWYVLRSTEGPYAVDDAAEGCKLTHTLISKIRPGQSFGWISDFTLDEAASLEIDLYLERKSDKLRVHQVSRHISAGAHRDGPQDQCYATPADITPGAYELRRVGRLYTPTGPEEVLDFGSIPIEVTSG